MPTRRTATKVALAYLLRRLERTARSRAIGPAERCSIRSTSIDADGSRFDRRRRTARFGGSTERRVQRRPGLSRSVPDSQRWRSRDTGSSVGATLEAARRRGLSSGVGQARTAASAILDLLPRPASDRERSSAASCRCRGRARRRIGRSSTPGGHRAAHVRRRHGEIDRSRCRRIRNAACSRAYSRTDVSRSRSRSTPSRTPSGSSLSDKPNAVVLDFFAGSGTTAHAVTRLNRQDGGRRQSIMVTNNEVSADEATALARRGLRPAIRSGRRWASSSTSPGPDHRRHHRPDAGRRADHGRLQVHRRVPDGRGLRGERRVPRAALPRRRRRRPRTWRSTTSLRCSGSGPARRVRSPAGPTTSGSRSRTRGPTATACCSTRTAGAASSPACPEPRGPPSS